MPRWSSWYVGTALVFGLVYYLWNRRKPAGKVVLEATPPRGGGFGRAMTGLVATLVVAATIAGLFPDVSRVGEAVATIVRSLPEAARRFLPEGRGSWMYLIYFEAAVMAVGFLWYWLNRAICDAEKGLTTPVEGDPNLERFGLYAGLLLGLGLSIRNGAKGWFNIYRQDRPENYWSGLLWEYLGPAFLVILVAIVLWVLVRPRSRVFDSWIFPHAYGLMWLVLIVQNAIAFAVTGPLSEWTEVAFAIYYLLLFLITAVIVFHESVMKSWKVIR